MAQGRYLHQSIDVDIPWESTDFDSQESKKDYPVRLELIILPKDNIMASIKMLCSNMDDAVKSFNADAHAVHRSGYCSEEFMASEREKDRKHQLEMQSRQLRAQLIAELGEAGKTPSEIDEYLARLV